MQRYTFAALDMEEAAELGELLAGASPSLRRKLIPATVPSLPGTILVLHDAHAAHRAVLLLTDDHTRAGLPELRMAVYELYGQELTDVPLSAAQSVDALTHIVRLANADETAEDDPPAA